MRLFDLAAHRSSRTGFRATHTSSAGFLIDHEGCQFWTDTGRTSFFMDMRLILVPKIFYGCQNWIRSAFSQTAQGCVLHGMADFFHQLNIAFLSSAFTDIGQYGLEMTQSFTARRTLTTGFITQEFNIIAGNLDHTASVIHDNHTA